MAITNRFTDIAVAIREKTGKSAMLQPADMPAEIRSISGGGGGEVTGYAEIEFPVALRTGTLYTFVSSAGDTFFSSSTTNTGIWRLDRDTKNIVKIYATSASWQYWFEDSDGNVFVSSTTTNAGILKWNGTTFTQVYAASNNWQYWFEDSDGNVFVSSGSSSGTGILRWDGATFTQVFATGNSWRYWFEDSDGSVFVSSSTGVGILKWDGTMFTQVFAASNSWQASPDGNDVLFTNTTLPYRLRLHNGVFVSADIFASGTFGAEYALRDSSFLWQGGAVVMLAAAYTSVTVSGDYAIAASSDKTSLLYIT